MIVSGIFFLSICLLIDYRVFQMLKNKIKPKSAHPPPIKPDIDEDVKKEMEKVKNFSISQILQRNLVLRGITKFYNKLLAVNQLYLDVDTSECFGLIGVNVSNWLR